MVFILSFSFDISKSANEFLEKSFDFVKEHYKYLVDSESEDIKVVTEKKYVELSSLFIDIVNAYPKNNTDYYEEIFFISINQGFKRAINNYIKRNLNLSSWSIQDVVPEDEFHLLFSKLKENQEDRSLSEKLLSHFKDEIHNIINEYDTIFNLTSSRLTLDRENFLSQAKENMRVRSQEVIDITDEKLEVVMSDIDNREKKLYETNISILGIFSAIVLTFNASISFFAAILESLATASTYKFILIILIIGFITTNVLFGLYAFLSLVYRKNDKKHNLKKNINKQILATRTEEPNNIKQDKVSTTNNINRDEILFSDNCNQDKMSPTMAIANTETKRTFSKEIWKPLLPMLVANLAFLVSFIVLYFTWNMGVIEDRNVNVSSDISSKISSIQEEAKKETLTLESETDKITENNSKGTSTELSN